MKTELKHEMFQLLKTAYPGASRDIREQLINQAKRSLRERPIKDEKEREIAAYEEFNLLHWLSMIAPDCPLVAAELQSIEEQYPHFQPREHPDLNWEEGEVRVGSISPVAVEELLGKNPANWLEYLLTFKGEDWSGPTRDGLLQTVTEAVQREPKWGIVLAELLVGHKEWTSDLWQRILWGLTQARLTGERWTQVLKTADTDELVIAQEEALSDLLYQGSRQKEGAIPPNLLEKADRIALKVWESVKNLQAPDGGGHLSSAIYHAGGKLTLFWLQAMSEHLKRAEQRKRIPRPYKDRFEQIVSEESIAASFGRVILASQLGFLFGLDQNWALTHVLPLFDWNQNREQAAGAWDAWLVGGRLTASLIERLIPHYKVAFSYIPRHLEGQRHRLAEHAAGIAVFWLEDPLQEWIPSFLQATEDEDRSDFAAFIGTFLENMETDARQKLWQRWLKLYWENRNQSLPVPLGNDEFIRMIEWLPRLEFVSAEAIDLACQGPTPSVQRGMLFYRLKDSSLAEDEPDRTTKLLLHLTSVPDFEAYHCPDLEQITERLIRAEANSNVLRELCDRLAAIGCHNAAALASTISG
ncbi:DUF4020 domain-containing protein [Acidobacteria bacterium AH-259-G07]|nr:DUF4020 domain-containing protein [Acidobacteria bacterium AH-259-G07]